MTHGEPKRGSVDFKVIWLRAALSRRRLTAVTRFAGTQHGLCTRHRVNERVSGVHAACFRARTSTTSLLLDERGLRFSGILSERGRVFRRVCVAFQPSLQHQPLADHQKRMPTDAYHSPKLLAVRQSASQPLLVCVILPTGDA